MSADTLTPDGAPLTLAPPPPGTGPQSQFSYTQTGFAVMGGNPDEVLIASVASQDVYGKDVVVSGYSLDGALLFQDHIGANLQADTNAWGTLGLQLATVPSGGVAAAWVLQSRGGLGVYPSRGETAVIASDGSQSPVQSLANQTTTQNLAAFSSASGYHLEWVTTPAVPDGQPPPAPTAYQQDFLASGQPAGAATSHTGGVDPAYASIMLAGADFTIQDNQAQFAGNAAATVPGEPAHAISDLAAAALADGHDAAVGWIDSGTDYVSIYHSSTNSFGPIVGLDWGHAADLHIVALSDGGFAVSWANGGAYKGELFDAAGNSGGIIALTGQFAAIDSHGDVYTVGLDSGGNEVIQTYAIGSGSGSSGGSGGSGGGTTGQTYTSDNNGDHWVGTSGNDTFNLGRGGDVVTGNGGNDTYFFAEVPWAGGHITDFNAGDVLDLTGLAHTTADTGTDGFADGYLKITDSSGGAQVWAQYATSGANSGWWLVETLDGVSGSSLTHSGDAITVGTSSSGGGAPPPTAVSTSDSNYVVPASVNSVTLTGSNQTVTAYDHQDLTIWSDNGANTIRSGSGDDVIHIGRGGDTVSGGGGRDVFVFDETPWAPATIQDFHAGTGDMIDVRALLAKAGYTGSDPVADGYLKIQNGEIDANYNQPGNDGWWVVAKGASAPGGLVYDNGFIHGASYIGGTYTTSTSYSDDNDFGHGYSTLITTGSDGGLKANDGGDTLIDNGVNNTLADGRGNDTLVLSPTTKEVFTGWGGLDTIVLAANPQVTTYDPYSLNGGDRIDLHQLLQGMGYTGSDPVADGYLQVYRAPQGMAMYPSALQVQFDPDGPGGAAAWHTVFQADGQSSNPHYSGGYFLF